MRDYRLNKNQQLRLSIVDNHVQRFDKLKRVFVEIVALREINDVKDDDYIFIKNTDVEQIDRFVNVDYCLNIVDRRRYVYDDHDELKKFVIVSS